MWDERFAAFPVNLEAQKLSFLTHGKNKIWNQGNEENPPFITVSSNPDCNCSRTVFWTNFEAFWNKSWDSSQSCKKRTNLNLDMVNAAPWARFALSLTTQLHKTIIAFLRFQMQFILRYGKCWSSPVDFAPYLCFPCHRLGPSRYSQQQQRSHAKFFLKRNYSLSYCIATDGSEQLDLAFCFCMIYYRHIFPGSVCITIWACYNLSFH